MKYRHTVTGAIVNVNSKITGNWELVEEKAEKKTRKASKKTAEEN